MEHKDMVLLGILYSISVVYPQLLFNEIADSARWGSFYHPYVIPSQSAA
jgi:hypothetical protein